MRHFSVILLVLCMLLPPALYLATAVVLEQQVQDRFTRAIEDVSTGDPQALLEGSIRLRDVLRTNIDAFLRASTLLRYGMSARVSVTTRGGAVLYPYPYDEDPGVPSPANPTAVARENFAFLSEGLVVQVDVILEHNRLLSNAVLGLYVGAALVVLLSTIEPPAGGSDGRRPSGAGKWTGSSSCSVRTPIGSPSCRATAKPWCRSLAACGPRCTTNAPGPSATRTTSSRKSNRSKSGSRRTCDIRRSSSRRSRPSRKT